MNATYRRMHHDDLDDASWDTPRRVPRRRVVICSTPRSGSYLLCRQMINAGLGLPTEYLRTRTWRRLHERWGVGMRDDDRYFDELEARRTSANGVFATKVQWDHFERNPNVRPRWLERADLIVFLYRHDLLAQAVSWQVSMATGLWSFDETLGPSVPGVSLEPSEFTLKLAMLLRRQNVAWNELIVGLGRPALSVRYESFAGAQSALLHEIASRLGLDPGDWTMPPPEDHDNRLPADVEAARVRLLAYAREAAAAQAPT